MLIRRFPRIASMEKPPPVHNLPLGTREHILVLSSRRNDQCSGAERGKKPLHCFKASTMPPNRLAHARSQEPQTWPAVFPSTYRDGKIAEEDDMLKRTFSGTLVAAVLGVAASGTSIPDFAQNLPA